MSKLMDAIKDELVVVGAGLALGAVLIAGSELIKWATAESVEDYVARYKPAIDNAFTGAVKYKCTNECQREIYLAAQLMGVRMRMAMDHHSKRDAINEAMDAYIAECRVTHGLV